MKSLLSVGFLSVLLILPACATEPEPAPAPEPEAMTDAADPADPADPLTGAWTGDWGPSAEHRNPVTLDLTLDGTALTGTINPGDESIELTSGTFDPATGMVMMEAQATNFQGAEVHYVIEGQVVGNTFSGDWVHENGQGTFSVMR
jgi:hypothetical protein